MTELEKELDRRADIIIRQEKQNKELQDKNWKLEEQITKWKEDYICLENLKDNQIKELEAQIEKMKCCYNCKHSRTEYEHCRTNKHEKWELAE